MGNRSYERLKEKNESLADRNKELQEQIKRYESGFVKAEGIPDFLFSSQASNEELFSYLKRNPGASKFLFKKYSQNKSFIEELCDPLNPLYLDEVDKELKLSREAVSLEDKLGSLRAEHSSLMNKKNDAEKEQARVESDLIQAQFSLEEEKKKLDNAKSELIRLQSIPAYEVLKKLVDSGEKLGSYVDEYLKDHTYNQRETFKDEIRQRKIYPVSTDDYDRFREALAEMRGSISAGNPFSDIVIDELMEEIKKRKEELEREKQLVQNEIDAVVFMNPKKKVQKIVEFLSVGCSQLDEGQPKNYDVIFPRFFFNGMRENFANALKATEHLDQQIKNVERSKKNEV